MLKYVDQLVKTNGKMLEQVWQLIETNGGKRVKYVGKLFETNGRIIKTSKNWWKSMLNTMTLIEHMMNTFGKMLKYVDQLLKTNGKKGWNKFDNSLKPMAKGWKLLGVYRTVYVIFRHIHIFHNSIFPLKMHSNCESMDVFQPTELWKQKWLWKNIITVWKQKV